MFNRSGLKKVASLALLSSVLSATPLYLSQNQVKLGQESASAQCESSYSNLKGAAAALLICGGKLIWTSVISYRVYSSDLSVAFAKAYGYCPSDVNVLANDYAKRNNSRFWFRRDNSLFFIKN